MAFWGVEVKPTKPYTHAPDQLRGRLRITQAMIGQGNSTKGSLLQCHVGDRSPINLCSLVPDRTEFCGLDLEFQEDVDVVFSVIGPRSIYLSGYYSGHRNSGGLDDDTDSYGEDIAESESDDSGSYDSEEDEYEDDFIDDGDIEMFDSPRPSGVIIEEIIDDEKPVNGSENSRGLKKNTANGDDDTSNPDRRLVKRNRSLIVESEDEDGFPVSSVKQKTGADASNAIHDVDQENPSVEISNADKIALKDSTAVDMNKQSEKSKQNTPEKQKGDKAKKKEKLKKKKKDKTMDQEAEPASNIIPDTSKDDTLGQQNGSDGMDANLLNDNSFDSKEKDNADLSNINEATAVTLKTDESSVTKKKKKKKRTKDEITSESERLTTEENVGNITPNTDDSVKKKKKKSKRAATVDENPSPIETVEQDASPADPKEEFIQPQQTRSFPNGLIVEELQMGKPDGKKATSGKKVAVTYVGKLKNGKIFDSNVGQRPFVFRLGVGEVIKGWDVGVNGMRIGDKRRLTIPPSMGYGSKNVGKIPPNSWLTFDVELADVK